MWPVKLIKLENWQSPRKDELSSTFIQHLLYLTTVKYHLKSIWCDLFIRHTNRRLGRLLQAAILCSHMEVVTISLSEVWWTLHTWPHILCISRVLPTPNCALFYYIPTRKYALSFCVHHSSKRLMKMLEHTTDWKTKQRFLIIQKFQIFCFPLYSGRRQDSRCSMRVMSA